MEPVQTVGYHSWDTRAIASFSPELMVRVVCRYASVSFPLEGFKLICILISHPTGGRARRSYFDNAHRTGDVPVRDPGALAGCITLAKQSIQTSNSYRGTVCVPLNNYLNS